MNQDKILILASQNQHKANEISALVNTSSLDFNLKVLSCNELDPAIRWDESGQSFAENAAIKANAVAKSLPHHYVLADDSGLVVPCLGGRPGIYSSRFAGELAKDADNNKKLLTELDNTPKSERAAYFICHLCFRLPNGMQYNYQGRLDGEIATQMRGDSGFGYDPIFIPEGYDTTLAALGSYEKNKISHRGRALRLWLNDLPKNLKAFDSLHR